MKVLVVEDEKQTADLLKELIQQHQGFSVTAILQSVQEAVHFLGKHQEETDLIFMDVQLADGKSFEIFRHIDLNIPIVFCTAFEDYALEAIKSNGIDYILKPFKEEEVHQALAKYERLVGTMRKMNLHGFELPGKKNKTYQENFLVDHRDRSLVIPSENVAMFSLEFGRVKLYSKEGARYTLFKSMEHFQTACNPRCFFRISRQMMVNRDAVVSLHPLPNRKLALELCFPMDELPVVSRLKVSHFKRWISA